MATGDRRTTGRAGRLPTHRAGLSHRPSSRTASFLQITSWALVASLFVFDGRAFARTEEGARLFAEGRAAFEAQQLEKALAAFEASVQAGLTGPAVHYNIGVAAYRLGSYDKAEAAFREVARATEWASLAHYNLGLIALKKEDRIAAREWFGLALSASDTRLRSLAEKQLATLNPQVQVERSEPVSQWSVYASLAGGHDSNVELLPDNAGGGVSGRSDEFAEAALSLAGPLEGPWRFDAAAFHVDYFDLDAFDQSAIVAGGARRFDLGAWNIEAGLQATYVLLDDSGFERDVSLTLRGTTRLSPRWWFRATYRGTQVDGLDEFEGISGWRHEAAARFDWRQDDWGASLIGRFETNHADDDEFSFSWYQVGGELRWSPAAWPMFVTLELAQQAREYDSTIDPDSDAKRDEDRTILAVEAGWRLGERVRVLARYESQENNSNADDFDYERYRYSLAIEYAN